MKSGWFSLWFFNNFSIAIYVILKKLLPKYFSFGNFNGRKLVMKKYLLTVFILLISMSSFQAQDKYIPPILLTKPQPMIITITLQLTR